ncbi:MAG: LrgB family protein [Bacteroidaceae bacterium]|nr:LrgB family protein [Bacteroidaceae bacterium]
MDNTFVLLALTFAVYYVATIIRKKTGIILLNPILITIAVMICYLKFADISYTTYNEGGKYIEFWLKPAIVALGVPLYKHLDSIKQHFIPIFLSQLAGCVVGIVSVVAIADLMGATNEVIISLAPKSVTTPIAIEISSALGGIESLTAAVVVCVGILGAVIGYRTMSIIKLNDDISKGLAMGTASHALGTAASMEVSPIHGVYATLGLIINGVLTSFFAPIILRIMGYL